MSGLAAAIGAAAFSSSGAEAGSGSTIYDGYSQSYSIPFVSKLDFHSDANPPQAIVRASINGGEAKTYQLDTGSQGMVVPSDFVPGFKPNGKPGSITYVSSGIEAVGYWTDVTVDFPDSTDGKGNTGVASATVKVLVATKVCDLGSGKCDRPMSDIPRMIGIGFDRPGAGDTGFVPSLLNNPLLHIEEMDAGTMRSGYVFSSDRIEVGLTGANAGNGFAMYKLLPTRLPNQAGKQWESLEGTIVVTRDGATTTRDLPLLLDTGIGYAWVDISGPSSGANCPSDDPTLPATAKCAAPGAEVTVYFGGSDQVGFRYETGDTDSLVAPWFTRTDDNTIGANVGIHPIAGFDYLFDAEAGFEGLRATGKGADDIVFEPFLSMAGRWALADPLTTDLPVYVRADAEIATAARTAFESAFTGPGALAVSGSGTAVFKADVTLAAGVTVAGRARFKAATTAELTVLSGGEVENEGRIRGDVGNAGRFANDGLVEGDVLNAGTLTGNGSIRGSLATTGLLSPGHSVGTVKVAGDAVFAKGSVYLAEIGGDGASDRLEVDGVVWADGAALVVAGVPGKAPSVGASYVVVDAGAVIGSFAVSAPDFANLRGAYPFLAVTASESDGAVELSVERSAIDFAAAAETENQAAVAGALDRVGTDAAIIDTIVGLDARSARHAYDQLSGAIYPSVRGMFAEQAEGMREAVLARLHQSAASPVAFGAVAPDSVALAPASPAAMWVTTYGDWGETQATGNVAAFSRTFAGMIGGIDTAVPASDWRLGIAAGYASTRFALDDDGSSGSSEGADFAAYAGGTLARLGPGAVLLNLGGGFGIHDVSVTRRPAYAGFSERLHSDFQATTAQAFGELAYAVEIARAGGMLRATVEPFAGLGTVTARTGSFAETSGAAALEGKAGAFGVVASQIGIRGATRLPVGGVPVEVGGTFAWQHVFSDPTPSADLAFAAGGGTFTVLGAPVAEDALLLGVGLDAALSARSRLGFTYSGMIGEDAANQAVRGTLSVRF